MAIKILNEGKKEVNVYRTKCCKCFCTFEFDERDAETCVSLAGRRNNFLEIRCPCCNIELYVENKPIRKEML